MNQNTKIIETIDTLQLSQVVIQFLSNLLNSWDIDKTPLTHNDLHGLSRICDKVSENFKELEKQLKESIEQ